MMTGVLSAPIQAPSVAVEAPSAAIQAPNVEARDSDMFGLDSVSHAGEPALSDIFEGITPNVHTCSEGGPGIC
ncbi:hypothetical protein MMC09_000970 [Bachmanniomyces sp. S44760]|nr:hypothetical protein [Bachmanniomyces sp. S44760]